MGEGGRWGGGGGRAEGGRASKEGGRGGEPVHEKHRLMPPSHPVNYKYVGRSTTHDRLQSASRHEATPQTWMQHPAMARFLCRYK